MTKWKVYDIDEMDESALRRTQHGGKSRGDAGSAEWKKPSRWRGEIESAVAGGCDRQARQEEKPPRAGQKKKSSDHRGARADTEERRGKPLLHLPGNCLRLRLTSARKTAKPLCVPCALCGFGFRPPFQGLSGAVKRPMPIAIHPMLATTVDEPFDGDEWLCLRSSGTATGLSRSLTKARHAWFHAIRTI